MTRDELKAWARDGAEQAMRDGNGPDGLFYLGVRDVALDDVEGVSCGAPGSIWESSYCEGLREGMQRLDAGAPVGRIGHGSRVEG